MTLDFFNTNKLERASDPYANKSELVNRPKMIHIYKKQAPMCIESVQFSPDDVYVKFFD